MFEEADARSIDQYIVLDGVSSSELDDEVTHFQDRTDADTPHIIVECLNRRSAIAVRKIYQLDPAHHEVLKRVEIDSPVKKILTIVSMTVLSDETRDGGYYYQYIGHTASRYSTFPTAAIPESYFVNGRNMQSGLCTVTRPDIDFTYGEVQLTINGIPEYMGLNADEFLNRIPGHTGGLAVAPEELASTRAWERSANKKLALFRNPWNAPDVAY